MYFSRPFYHLSLARLLQFSWIESENHENKNPHPPVLGGSGPKTGMSEFLTLCLLKFAKIDKKPIQPQKLNYRIIFGVVPDYILRNVLAADIK